MSLATQSYSPERGIHLCSASENILKEGDLITREQSSIYVIEDKNLKLNCSNCARGGGERQRVLLVCAGCRIVSYCNQKCQKLDWKRGHKLECPLYGYKKAGGGPTTTVRLLIRCLVRNHIDPFLNLASKSSDGERQSQKIGSLSRLATYPLKDDEKTQIFSQIIASLSSLIAKDRKFSFLSQTTGKEMMRILKIIDSNIMALQCNLETVGRVLFLAELSFANHSCLPNAVIVFNEGLGGVEATLRCNREILQGDEIVISYIDVLESTQSRQKHLYDQYGFHCDCVRCSSQENDDFYGQALLLQSHLDNASWKEASFLAEKLADQLSTVFGPCFPEVSLMYLKAFRCRKVFASTETHAELSQLLDLGRKAHGSLSRLHHHIDLLGDLDQDLRVLTSAGTTS